MLDPLSEVTETILKSIGPIAQLGFVAVIAVASVWAMFRGERDRKGGGTGGVEIPGWVMGGPVHDAIDCIRDLAEETRRTNDLHEKTNVLLVDIGKGVERLNTGQSFTHRILEDVLREREMKGDMFPKRPRP
jgi:hypothetical protein